MIAKGKTYYVIKFLFDLFNFLPKNGPKFSCPVFSNFFVRDRVFWLFQGVKNYFFKRVLLSSRNQPHLPRRRSLVKFLSLWRALIARERELANLPTKVNFLFEQKIKKKNCIEQKKNLLAKKMRNFTEVWRDGEIFVNFVAKKKFFFGQVAFYGYIFIFC